MNYHSKHGRLYFNFGYYKNDIFGTSAIDIICHRFGNCFKIDVLSNSVSVKVPLPDLQKATYFPCVFTNWREGADVSFPSKNTNPMVRAPSTNNPCKKKSISKVHLSMSLLKLQQKNLKEHIQFTRLEQHIGKWIQHNK